MGKRGTKIAMVLLDIETQVTILPVPMEESDTE